MKRAGSASCASSGGSPCVTEFDLKEDYNVHDLEDVLLLRRTRPREHQHDLEKEGDILNLLDVLLLKVVYDLKSTKGDMPTRRD